MDPKARAEVIKMEGEANFDDLILEKLKPRGRGRTAEPVK